MEHARVPAPKVTRPTDEHSPYAVWCHLNAPPVSAAARVFSALSSERPGGAASKQAQSSEEAEMIDGLANSLCPSANLDCLLSSFLCIPCFVVAYVLIPCVSLPSSASASHFPFLRLKARFPWPATLALLLFEGGTTAGLGAGLTVFRGATFAEPGQIASSFISASAWATCLCFFFHCWKSEHPVPDVVFLWIIVAALVQTAATAVLLFNPLIHWSFIFAGVCSSLAAVPLMFIAAWVLSHSGAMIPPYGADFLTSREESLPPSDQANLLSRLTFSWVGRLLETGSTRALQECDLPSLCSQDSAAAISESLQASKARDNVNEPRRRGCFDRWFYSYEAIDRIQRRTDVSLAWRLARAFGGTLLSAIVLKLSFDALKVTSPLLVNEIISFLEAVAAHRAPSLWVGLALCVALAVSAVAQTMLLHQYFFLVFRCGQQLRSAIILEVFQKSLRLSSAARVREGVGKLTNLMAADSKRIQDLTTYLVIIVSGPFQIIFALALLYTQLGGIPVFVGVAIMIAFLPVNAVVASLTQRFQDSLMKLRDERVRITSESLVAVRLLKFNAWEDAFRKRVEDARERELKQLRYYVLLQMTSEILYLALPLLVALGSLVTFAYLNGHPPSPPLLFSSLSLFEAMRFPLSMVPSVVNSLIEANISLRRLQRFLLLPELDTKAVLRLPLDTPNRPSCDGAASLSPGPPSTDDYAICFKDASFSWSDSDSHEASPVSVDAAAVSFEGGCAFTLANVTWSVKRGTLGCVIGSVGSGKSTLLHAVLGEVSLVSGTVEVRGSIAYAPQIPFILNATLRDNILFGRPMNEAAYASVLDRCQLLADIAQFDGGDLVEIGERGIGLSGGQKARVGLARAVYSNPDVLLLDDVFSAVDAHVGAAIFQHCICELLNKRTTVILATHGLQFVQSAAVSTVVLLEAGRIVESSMSGLRIQQYFEQFVLNAELTATPGVTPQEVDCATLPPSSTIAASTQNVTDSTSVQPHSKSGVGSEQSAERRPTGTQTATETREIGHVRGAVYAVYVRAFGGWMAAAGVVVLFGLYQVVSSLTAVFLTWWENSSLSSGTENFSALVQYSMFTLGSIAILVFAHRAIALGSIQAARALHRSMLGAILQSPLSFFETTPQGRILNRFTQDTNTVDEKLVVTFASLLTNSYTVIGTLVLVTAVTPAFLIAVIPLCICYFFVQRYYVSTSRELQRLESVSRSPVFALFSETLTGATVIRAMGVISLFEKRNAALLDANQRAYFSSTSANRWLAVRLEVISALASSAAALCAVLGQAPGDTSFPALAGLSISTALGVTQVLNWMVRMMSDAESQVCAGGIHLCFNFALARFGWPVSQVVAVERVKEYCDLPAEQDIQPRAGARVHPPPSWPSAGALSIRGLSVGYRIGTPLVLQDIDLEIRAGEKIGVCGRTGSGKSSLLGALFRATDVQDGSIFIDGIDIGSVPVQELRARLTLIPQDPVLVSGRVRHNLDPLHEHDDSALWQVLEQVSLRAPIAALPGGLDATVEDGGANFSVGQRQLLTCARALLRRSRIVVLDEASSATDVASDAALQRAVRSCFAGSTVLTIAHRIHTIIDSDRVLVLDAGRAIEFDTPAALLSRPESRFAALVHAAAAPH